MLGISLDTHRSAHLRHSLNTNNAFQCEIREVLGIITVHGLPTVVRNESAVTKSEKLNIH